MRMIGGIGVGLLLAIAPVLKPTRVQAQAACVEHCGAVSCGGSDSCGLIYDTCVRNCRSATPPAPDGWVVLALSKPDFAAAVGHGFTSKEAAAQEALTACRRNRGADCKVVWSGVNICMSFAYSVNSKWVLGVAGGSTRAEAVSNALLDCRKAGGENCVIRNTPCSYDDNRFNSPFEAASDVAIVDPRTVGTWELPMEKGRWVWQIDRRGTYKFHSETGDGGQHAGSFASNGKVWELSSSGGLLDGGIYTLEGNDLFVATGKLGTGRWRRVSNSP
jgi:Domain of unknown function (DUF4189)